MTFFQNGETSVAKEIERKEEKDFIIRDGNGEPVGLAIDHPCPWDEGDRVRSLYPGQPQSSYYPSSM